MQVSECGTDVNPYSHFVLEKSLWVRRVFIEHFKIAKHQKNVDSSAALGSLHFLIYTNIFVVVIQHFAGSENLSIILPGESRKYSCLTKHETQTKRGVFKNKMCVDYQ